MEKNPFNELIYQIKDISRGNMTENKIFNIGIITSPLPDLKVKTSDIELDKDNLYIDKWLLDRHEETETSTEGTHTHGSGEESTEENEDIDAQTEGEDGGTIEEGGSGESSSNNAHTHDGGGHFHKSKDYVDELKAGDKVIMLREGDMFFIISKVVKIDE